MAKTTLDRRARGERSRRGWRRSAAVLATTAAFAAAAFVGASLVPPRYRAEASVVLEGPGSFDEGSGSGASSAGERLDPALAMTSNEILAEVARRLDLSSREEFSESWTPVGRLAHLFGGSPGAPGASVVERMRERLRVYPARNLRIIVTEFAAHDPALARDVANAVVAEYLAGTERQEQAFPDVTAERIEGEISELTDRIAASNDRLTELRAFGAGEEGEGADHLSALTAELSEAKAAHQAAEAGARWTEAALAGGRPPEAAPEGLEAPALEALLQRRDVLDARKAELSITLLDEHPRMKAVNADLGDVEEEISRAAAGMRAELRRRAEAAAARVASLDAEVARLTRDAAEAERLQAEIRSQEQTLATDRERLVGLLQCHDALEGEAGAAGIDATTNARLFAEAELPAEPYFPKPWPITAAGGLAGLVISSLALLLAGALPARASRPPAGKDASSAAHPGEADRLKPLEEHATVEPPVRDAATMPEAAGVDELAEAIVASAISRIVVVSPAVDAGTPGSVDLARRLSSGSRSSILVDLSPGDAAARSMGVGGNTAGIADLLDGTALVADTIQRDHFTAAHVVPSRGGAAATGGWTAELAKVLDTLSSAYDHVVLACGAENLASLRPLMHRDAALLVSVSPGFEDEARRIVERLRQAGFDDVLLMRSGELRDRPSRHEGL